MSDDKESEYYSISEAIDNFTIESFGAKEKTISGLKLFGKGIFNVGKYAAKEALPAMVKQVEKEKSKQNK